MYHDLERRSPPELPQQTASSNPEAARKPRTTMKYQPFSAVYDHSCNPDSTFLLVAMYKSICICGCQWGVYASTWPIKKKKKVCVMPQVFTTDDSEFLSRALGPKSGISTTITRKIWANMEYRCSQIHDGLAPVSTPPRASTNKTPSASQPGL